LCETTLSGNWTRLAVTQALAAKKALGLWDGAFWQNESYDHLVRSEKENPVKAGCVQRPEQ
jgi:REP element-mobilizing transposase RayT